MERRKETSSSRYRRLFATGCAGSFSCSGIEGVALRRIAALQPALEPLLALRRSAVGEAVGNHRALPLALQRVVADRVRRGHAFLDVTRLQPSAALGPHTGI